MFTYHRGHRRAPQPSRVFAAVFAVIIGTAFVAAISVRPADATPHDFAEPIFTADARGDITTIGNVTTTCDPGYTNQLWSPAASAAACNGAITGATGLSRYDGAPLPPINNRLSMEFVDIDTDGATANSSSAALTVPEGSVVLWAGLHWNGATEVPTAPQLYGSTYQEPPPDVGSRFQVSLATPASGGYVPLDAAGGTTSTRDRWDDVNPGGTVSYGAYVDVTDLVSAGGSGTYTAAGVQSCRGFGGCFGSWSLTVAFANEALPPRNLNVWHGWQLTTPTLNGGEQSFTVGGLTPPPNGPVTARIGVVQADGDRGLGPDSLDISSPTNPQWQPFTSIDRPLSAGEQDWFNSTVTVFGQRRPDSEASPNLLANLNQDIALVSNATIIGNDDSSFSFRVRTTGSESLYSQVVHSAVDLYTPEIDVTKTVSATDPVAIGTEVTWTLDVANVGIDAIREAVVDDPLPEGLEYVPGSVVYATGGPEDLLGPKTDQSGDDQAEWDPVARRLVFRVGQGADQTQGGTMHPAPAANGSDQLSITYRTVVTAPTDAIVVNQATARGRGRTLQDPFGPIETSDDDEAQVQVEPTADLGVTKTDSDAVVHAIGDRFTYSLMATNAGPSVATEVVITDDLIPELSFVSGNGCEAIGQRVTCGIGDLGVGDQQTVSFEVEVVELPPTDGILPNLATIGGSQPDPDCTSETPDALCNTDDEETPIEPTVPPSTTSTTVAEPPSTTTSAPAKTPSKPAPGRPKPSGSPPRKGSLPRTGTDPRGLLAVGAGLLGGGAVVLVLRRRHHA